MINLGNVLLDFLHYYGEILDYLTYGIFCRKPNDRGEQTPNFYPRLSENLYNPN
jgi:hypothetical protein